MPEEKLAAEIFVPLPVRQRLDKLASGDSSFTMMLEQNHIDPNNIPTETYALYAMRKHNPNAKLAAFFELPPHADGKAWQEQVNTYLRTKDPKDMPFEKELYRYIVLLRTAAMYRIPVFLVDDTDSVAQIINESTKGGAYIRQHGIALVEPTHPDHHMRTNEFHQLRLALRKIGRDSVPKRNEVISRRIANIMAGKDPEGIYGTLPPGGFDKGFSFNGRDMPMGQMT